MTALAIAGVPATFSGTKGVAIATFTVTATGGTSPYVFTEIGAPSGVSINSSTGVVSGTPTASGDFNVQFEVTDAASALSMANSHFIIASNLVANQATTFSVPRQQFLVVGKQITPVGLTVSNKGGFVDPITYSASWLPPGLAIDSTTGLLSGTPTVSVGDQDIFLYAVDANGVRFSGVVNFIIVPAVNVADTSQENEQSGMLLEIQRPGCLGISGALPQTNVESIVLNAQAAMALAYPA